MSRSPDAERTGDRQYSHECTPESDKALRIERDHPRFSHVNEQPMKVMKKSGFVDLVGEENFCSHISDALKHAEELISR